MKTILLILALVFQNTTAFGSFETDPDLAKAMVDCQASKSKRWDSLRNMCVTTQEAFDTRNEVNACGELTGAAQKACHDRIAEEKTGVKAGSEDGKDPLMLISLLGAGVTGLMILAAKKSAGSTCTSLYIMGATSVAGLAAEFLYKRDAKKKLTDLTKKYKAEAAIESTFAAQKRAFEYLKEEQLAISELAKKRFHSYLAVTAGYSAAAIYAILESTGSMGIKKCGGSEKAEADAEAPAGGDAATADAGATTPGPEATATTTATPPAAGGTPSVPEVTTPESGAAANTVFGAGAGAALGSPMGIAVIAGMGAVTTGFLASKARKQEKQSKEQADRIQTIIDGFNEDQGAFCPNGREDLREPKCYCYNNNGTENKDRTNSQTCQALWAERNRNLAVRASDYSGSIGKVDRKGCFFVNQQFDPDCRCRDLKNASGDNACMKVGMQQNQMGSVGQAMSLPQVLGDLNKMVQGEFDAANISSADLAKRSAVANQMRQKIFDDYSKDPKNRQKFPNDEAMLKNIIDRASKANLKSVPLDPINNMASLRPALAGLNQALENAGLNNSLDKQLLEAVGYKPSGGLVGSAGAKKQDDDYFFDFGATSGSGSGVMDGFMEQNYDFGGNDISSRNDVSIWEMISHRYVQTGLRRLFGDDIDKVNELE